ncbi:hypothetical protein AVEN_39073-1, partial [Araneus ventricosus]
FTFTHEELKIIAKSKISPGDRDTSHLNKLGYNSTVRCGRCHEDNSRRRNGSTQSSWPRFNKPTFCLEKEDNTTQLARGGRINLLPAACADRISSTGQAGIKNQSHYRRLIECLYDAKLIIVPKHFLCLL